MEMGHFQTVPSWGSLVWAPLSSNVTLKPLKGKGDPAGQEALCAGPGHPALPLGCLWPHCVFLRSILWTLVFPSVKWSGRHSDQLEDLLALTVWASLAGREGTEQGILKSGGVSLGQQWVTIICEGRTLQCGRSRSDLNSASF